MVLRSSANYFREKQISFRTLSKNDAINGGSTPLPAGSMATTQMKEAENPKKVIVYRKELLRVTETFIKAQVRSYQRWQAVLFGERIWPGGLSLEGVDSRTLIEGPVTSIKRIAAKARQTAGVAPASVMRKFKAVNAKLMHAHFGHDAILALPYARNLNVPLVVTLHGHDVNIREECYRSHQRGFWGQNYPAQFAAMVKLRNVHFIAVSKAIRKAAIDFGVPKDRIAVCYTGIDIQQFQPGPKPMRERPRRIVFVGRLVEMKGCAYLIEAFQEVSRSIPDAELVVVGDGPLRGDLEALAKKLAVRVQFLGAVTPDVVKEHLNEARVFCLPSITASNGNFESFGMVLLEAQASGVPVVTSALGGMEGLADGVTGFAFAEKDVSALVRHVCGILGNSDLASRMSEAGPEYVRRHFDIMSCTKIIEDLYDDILSPTSTAGTTSWGSRSIFFRPWNSLNLRKEQQGQTLCASSIS
jgi:glycosyltransferase involved in cell wall biosynthesis